MSRSVCPWWMGYILLFPLRKWLQNPDRILGPHISRGMTVIDYGSAMGFFSLPMARLVGPDGRVHCFDSQPKMLEKLAARAQSAGLSDIIKTHLAASGIQTPRDICADFTLLFAVAHEVSDQRALFESLFSMMKPGAILLFAEPPGHVSDTEFRASVELAVSAGFIRGEAASISKTYSILMRKPSA